MKIEKLTAREDYSRADIFLSKNLDGVTRSSVKKLFESGNVKCADKTYP